MPQTTTLHTTGIAAHFPQMETDQHHMTLLTRTHTATIHQSLMSTSGITPHHHGLHAVILTVDLLHLLTVLMSLT